MSRNDQGGGALRLREEFDRSFSEATPGAARGAQALLALSVGGDAYALRVSDLSGLAKDRRLAALPGLGGGFLGLAGLRGALLPAWDLAQLLGYPQERSRPRWLALASGEPAWAAAFERFEGYLSLAPEFLRPYEAQGLAAAFADSAALDQGRLRPILDLQKIRNAIQQRNPQAPQRSLS